MEERERKQLIYIILAVICGIVVGVILAYVFSKSRSEPPNLAASNLEIWKYTDWKGKERTIEVHRQVGE